MDKYKKEFFDRLECTTSITVIDFIRKYDEQKAKIICKILTHPTDITKDEWETINARYYKDAEIAKAIIKSSEVDASIKKQVFDKFINKSYTGDSSFSYDMTQLILENYTTISPTDLYLLFFIYCNDSMSAFRNIESTLPHINRLYETFVDFYIDTLKGRHPKPSLFSNKSPDVFSKFTDRNLYNKIISNMPSGTVECAIVATHLINNPNLSDEQRNFVFDNFPYTKNWLVNPTFYVAESLYESAISMYEIDFKTISKEKQDAIYFLEQALNRNFFPLSIQKDLAYRLISNDKKHDVKNRNKILDTLIETTRNPEVLEIIFHNAPHVSNRDTVCYNLYVTPQILREQAEIYANKIKKELPKKPGKYTPEKWYRELENAIKKTCLPQEIYDIVIATKRTHLYCALSASPYTPPNVIKEITPIAINSYDDYFWKVALIHCLVRQTLNELNLDVTKNFKKATNLLETIAYNSPKIPPSLSAEISSIVDKCDREIVEQLPKLLSQVFGVMNKRSDISEYQKIVAECEKIIKKEIDIKYNPDSIKDALLKQKVLDKKMNEMVTAFSEMVQTKDIECYLKLNDYVAEFTPVFDELAKRYTELNEELNSRSLETALPTRA